MNFIKFIGVLFGLKSYMYGPNNTQVKSCNADHDYNCRFNLSFLIKCVFNIKIYKYMC